MLKYVSVISTSFFGHSLGPSADPSKPKNEHKMSVYVSRTTKAIFNCLTGKLVFTECNSFQLYSE